MGENRWGMEIILATPHADWKERHKIATDRRRNTIVLEKKKNISKIETY